MTSVKLAIDKGYKLSKNWSWIREFFLNFAISWFHTFFLSVEKRKKAGKFPAFFCELFGYFWKILWTIVDVDDLHLSISQKIIS